MTWLRAVAVAAVLVPLAPAADWPQWLGTKRDGGTTEVVSPWTQPPAIAWRAKVGPGFSSPVAAGGRVFVHARVPNKEAEELVAFDAATGKELWRTAYDRPPYSSNLNTGPQATPAVVGNRVYTFGITGALACFAADTGKQLWRTDVLQKFGANPPRFGVCSSPLVIGNRVLVAAGGKGSSVAAFDAATGDLAWQALDEPAATSSPVLFVAKGRVGPPDVVFMTTLRVVGVSPLDGAVRWEFPLPYQPAGTSPTPVVAGDRVVTSTMTNGTTAIAVPSDGSPAVKAWQAKKLSGYFSTGVATADRLYLVTNTLKPIPRADLACVDAASGQELWRKEAVGYFHFAVTRTGDGKLLILDDTGTLKLVADDATTYRELCAAKVCNGTLVAPAVAGGRVFARDDKELVCVRVGP